MSSCINKKTVHKQVENKPVGFSKCLGFKLIWFIQCGATHCCYYYLKKCNRKTTIICFNNVKKKAILKMPICKTK